jgi:hypothetical protein
MQGNNRRTVGKGVIYAVHAKTVNRVLVWYLETSLFSLGTEDDMCQNVRTEAIKHGSQIHYAIGNCF